MVHRFPPALLSRLSLGTDALGNLSSCTRCSDRGTKVSDCCFPFRPPPRNTISSSTGLAFVDMLNAMRFGKIDQDMTRTFRTLERDIKYNDGIEPTEL